MTDKHWGLGALVALAALAAPLGGVAQTAAAPPSVETFYRHPDLIEVRLSPTGRRLAMTVANGGRVGLGLVDLDGDGRPRLLARHDDADIREFRWVSDERLVYSVIDLELGSGDQRFGAGLFGLDIQGGAVRELVRARRDFISNRSVVGRQPLESNHRLLAVPEDGSNEVIVGRFAGDTELREVIPLRLNVATLRARSVGIGMPAGTTRWAFDSRGEPRVAGVVREGQFTAHWRAPGSEQWTSLASSPNFSRAWTPWAVDDDGGLYVTAAEGRAQTGTLRRFDFAAGAPAKGDPLVRTPGFDFRGALIQDWGGGPVLGVRAETDAWTTVWFDARLAGWQRDADERLRGRVNQISCRRCTGDDPVLLVHSWSDRQPGEFWIWRPTREGRPWTLAGRKRRDVDATRMATLDFQRIDTRDGLSMPVWLTLPAGADKGARRPAVLLVHGGPWVRGGHWNWDADAQFLASRGYVVIEPEFRGSTGYGHRHFSAGRKQWGQAMEDDLADAVRWAVAQGWVDPQRVCIAGASYGGYAALMGPIRYPDMFRCAVAWAAVTDPILRYTLAWSDLDEEGRNFSLPELMGDPVKDEAMLIANSPLRQAAKLKVPVLLAHGGEDTRVPVTHAEKMRAALTEAGNKPEWVTYPDEWHGWLKPQNRFDFARRMEAFLARHLKPGEAAAPR